MQQMTNPSSERKEKGKKANKPRPDTKHAQETSEILKTKEESYPSRHVPILTKIKISHNTIFKTRVLTTRHISPVIF